MTPLAIDDGPFDPVALWLRLSDAPGEELRTCCAETHSDTLISARADCKGAA